MLEYSICFWYSEKNIENLKVLKKRKKKGTLKYFSKIRQNVFKREHKIAQSV